MIIVVYSQHNNSFEMIVSLGSALELLRSSSMGMKERPGVGDDDDHNDNNK